MKPKVVVAGTRFGQVYLEALARADGPFTLAGIVAGGSERSRACAGRHGVPLYTDIGALPDDISLACVVIRGGLLGGAGSQVARDLMARGIHVLQEHPVHHDELAENLRAARRHKVVYQLNPFYSHIGPVRSFIAAAKALLTRQQPSYVDAACGFQLAYSLLDILGNVLGKVRPWTFGELPALAGEVSTTTSLDFPFRSLDGVLGGIPITLRVQNQLDPADPDNYAHLMHRISIGTEAGNLTLLSTHGPVVWTGRPDFPRDVVDADSRPHFERESAQQEPPSAVVLGPDRIAPYPELFRDVWAGGVVTAVERLHAAVGAGEDPMRQGQFHLSLCRLWQELTARLGPPELLSSAPPRMLTGEDLAALAAAGGRP